jgi:hypothetical protein
MGSAIECGAVSVNGLMIPSYQTPFGGFKQSGIGKELGKYGLLEYMRTKTVHIKYVGHLHYAQKFKIIQVLTVLAFNPSKERADCK